MFLRREACFVVISKLELFPAIVIIFASYYTWDVWGGRTETIAYAALCIGLIVILGVALIATSGEHLRRTQSNHAQTSSIFESPSTHAVPMMLLLALTVHSISQQFLGFLVSTAAVASGLFFLLGERRIIQWLVWSAGFVALTYLILLQTLNIPLPTGLFGE